MIRIWVPVPTSNNIDETTLVLKNGEFAFHNGLLYEGDGQASLGALTPMSFPATVIDHGDGTATI